MPRKSYHARIDKNLQLFYSNDHLLSFQGCHFRMTVYLEHDSWYMTHWLGHDARIDKNLEILSWSDTWSWTWLTSWLRTLNLIWFLANNYGFYKTRMGINVKLTITRSLVQVKNFFLLEDLQGHVIIMWSIMWYITWQKLHLITCSNLNVLILIEQT